LKATDNYLKFPDCNNGFLYQVEARNFSLGVFDLKSRGFIGIRSKFGHEYLNTEFHWDMCNHYGTVKPIKEIEEIPGDIDISENLIYEDPKPWSTKLWAIHKETKEQIPVHRVHFKESDTRCFRADTGELIPDNGGLVFGENYTFTRLRNQKLFDYLKQKEKEYEQG